jgi:hypothetical protein
MQRILRRRDMRVSEARMQRIARAGMLSGNYVKSIAEIKVMIFETEVQAVIGPTFHDCE